MYIMYKFYLVIHYINLYRCGIALDPNLIPVHDEVYSNGGVEQPLLFINSELGYQWKDNLMNITKLLKPTYHTSGIPYTITCTLCFFLFGFFHSKLLATMIFFHTTFIVDYILFLFVCYRRNQYSSHHT